MFVTACNTVVSICKAKMHTEYKNQQLQLTTRNEEEPFGEEHHNSNKKTYKRKSLRLSLSEWSESVSSCVSLNIK